MNYYKYFKRQIPTIAAIIIFLCFCFVLMVKSSAPASGEVSENEIKLTESAILSESRSNINADFQFISSLKV